MKWNRFICKLFGHNWLYGDEKGFQHQPTKRACLRCKKVQTFYGEMTRHPGTFGQFWYDKSDWRSDTEQEKFIKEQNKLQDQYNLITRKP